MTAETKMAPEIQQSQFNPFGFVHALMEITGVIQKPGESIRKKNVRLGTTALATITLITVVAKVIESSNGIGYEGCIDYNPKALFLDNFGKNSFMLPDGKTVVFLRIPLHEGLNFGNVDSKVDGKKKGTFGLFYNSRSPDQNRATACY